MEGRKKYSLSPPEPSPSRGYQEPPVETILKPSANESQASPDGGLKAWMQVLGTFFIFFNTWWAFLSFKSLQISIANIRG
jgi:hypothetical protein